MKKRIFSFVLAVLMIASLLPATALAADIVDSGTCGAEVTWTLDSEGVLTISGSGDMHDYVFSGAPWYGSRSRVKSAVIAEGVTSIGSYAFAGCTSLTSVTIPNSVTSIGDDAFWECTSLTSVTIPDSVTSIGAGAFGGCTSLTSVTIPDSVTSIGQHAFNGCRSLTSVTIPDGVTSIGAYAFSECSSLTSVTIPDSVTSIGGIAFGNCKSLTSVTIPDSVTSIGVGAFQGCISLTSVTIPDSVTSIGEYAFSGCTSLTSVTIPDSVTSIDGWAFYNCTSLTDVYYAGSEAQWKAISISSTRNDDLLTANIHYNYVSHTHSYKDVVTAPTCTEKGYTTHTCACGDSYVDTYVDALGHAWDEGKVTKEPTETETGVKTFTCTRCGETKTEVIPATGVVASGTCGAEGDGSNLTWTLDSEGVLTISGSGGMHDYDGPSSPPWYRSRSMVKSAVIADGVTSIGVYAFCECRSLTSVTIPDSVTLIDDAAFYNCSSLTSVTIPDSVTSIGWSAFKGCASLTDVYYAGSEAQWKAIQISYENDALLNANIHYNYVSHTHSYKDVVTAPTCTEKGYTTHTCACGDSYVDTYVDALGHAWDEGKVTKEPTETETGVKTFTCTRCGETKTETIPKLTHEHSYKAAVTAPTCTEKGYTTHTCACGDSYVDTYTDPLGHDLKDDAAIAATCTTAGTTAGKHCTRCDYKEGMETIAALGHDLKDDAAVAATCTTAGTTAGKHCTRCDYKEGMETIAALGHDLKDDAAVAATCTTAGTTAGKHCTRCDYKEGMETIAALGHAWDEGKVTKEATETTQGSMTYTCTRCSATKRDILPASGLVATAAYNDVKNDTSWFYPGVQYCLSYGLMSGMGNGSFAPGEYTTRAQVAQILYNLHGNPEVSGGTPFTDVPEGAWYQKAVTWAHSVGIVNGVTATTFSPNANITRQDFVLMLMRYLNNVRMVDRTWTPDDLSRFVDAGSVGFWALDAMKDAVAINAISGVPVDGRLYIQPARNATRAEAAKILMVFHETMTK